MRLTLTGISRTFRGPVPITALDGVDLSVREGEFLAIVGPSGGGKSTLLNTIGLLDRPDSGSYTVGDVDAAGLNDRERARLRSGGFGFVFQSFHLLDDRPTVDSVELGLLYRGVGRGSRRGRAIEALARVGLDANVDQRASLLSGGQRQRVAIARALAADAEVIVADEPTGNLDSVTGRRIVDVLLALRDEGRTVVLVTHDRELARRADRVAHLRDGRVVEIEQLSERSIRIAGPRDTVWRHGAASVLRPADALRDALATVVARVGRTAGLVGAVATAVGLAVASIGIANSSSAQVSARFDLHANPDVTVTRSLDHETATDTGAEAAGRHDLRADARRMLARTRQLAGVDAAAVVYDRGSTIVRATPERPALQAPAVSVVGDPVDAARLTISWVPNHPHALGPDEVLVGVDLADQLPLGAVTAGPVVSVSDVDVVVAGVITRSPRVPSYLGAILTGGFDSPALEDPRKATVLLRTASGAAQQVARQAPVAIELDDPGSLIVEAPTDPTTLRAEIEDDVRSTLLAFTVVALLAAVVALGNAMLLGVLARRAEFGLRRAVGARPVHIAALVMCESAIVGALGGVVGLFGGLGTVLGITVARQWVPVFDLWLAPAALGGGILVGCLGGLVAAWRATRIEPQEALRS